MCSLFLRQDKNTQTLVIIMVLSVARDLIIKEIQLCSLHSIYQDKIKDCTVPENKTNSASNKQTNKCFKVTVNLKVKFVAILVEKIPGLSASSYSFSVGRSDFQWPESAFLCLGISPGLLSPFCLQVQSNKPPGQPSLMSVPAVSLLGNRTPQSRSMLLSVSPQGIKQLA